MRSEKLISISMHASVWVLLFIMPYLIFDFSAVKLFEFSRVFNFAIAILFFYFNYFILVPNFLLRKRIFIFFLVIVLSVGVSIGLSVLIKNVAPNAFLSEKEISDQSNYNTNEVETTQEVYAIDESSDKQFNKFIEQNRKHFFIKKRFTSLLILFVLFSFLISTIIKLTREWYQNEKLKQEMENTSLKSELSFLKSQVNPHFLFNTLNGIYALAIKKSDETPTAIVKLSELMRYMLYESEKDLVLLDDEIEYLRNFIELQKLRLPKNASIVFNTGSNVTKGITIEPMLFIAFVENAFKHGQDIDGVEISVELKVNESELILDVVNSISNSASKDHTSGIGLVNIRKRLDLLYGENYNLEQWVHDNYYNICLKLKLKKP